jgi:membrane glycosyltransferase
MALIEDKIQSVQPPVPVESEVRAQNAKGRGVRRMIQSLVTMALWMAAVFASAGRLDWTRGWICTAAYVIGMTLAGLLVRRSNPGLLDARANWRRRDTKPFDKVFLASYLPLTLIQPIVAGLDAVRFGWSSMRFATVYVGLVLFATWLNMAGVNVKDAQALMRHAHAATTQDIYQQFVPESQRRAVDRLSSLGGMVQ